MDVQVNYSYLQFALEPVIATHTGKVITLILWYHVINVIVTQYDTQKNQRTKVVAH